MASCTDMGDNTSASTSYIIYFGAHAITLNRKLSRSKTHRTTIRVHSDGRVTIHAPHEMSKEAIMAFAQQRAAWIWKHLQLYQNQPAPTPQLRYRDGESHWYLGKRYLLKVIRQVNAVPHAKLLQGKLEVYVPAAYPKYIKEGVYAWYKTRAKEVFQERLESLIHKTPWVKGLPPVSVRMTRRSWGSCSRDGRVMLNLHLIKAPRVCIDYVLLHELCHIAEHNHSPRFYAHLSQVMPEWKDIRTKLSTLSPEIMQGAY